MTFSFNQFLRDLLPTKLKIKGDSINNLYQWVKSIITPIKNLYSDFRNYRSDVLYEINHTAQVLSLEHLLNDKFGLPFPVNIPGSIYITDGYWLNRVFLFNNGSDWLSNFNDEIVYLFNNSELPTIVDNLIMTGFNTTINGEYEPTIYINGKLGYQLVSDNSVKLEWNGLQWEFYQGATIHFISEQDKDPRFITIFKDNLLVDVTGWTIIYHTFIYNNTEFDVDQIDFVVYVPMAIYVIAENLNIIKAYLNKYKAAGTSYLVLSY